jgi:transcriptional regulator with GAF, ATPase, and Fis domain
MLYNDAWRPILGKTKHPAALGRPGIESWPEIWDIIGAQFTSVLTRGEATWSDDLLLVVERNNYREEAYFTYSYSPIKHSDGSIGGVFSAINETTERVLGERRLRILRELAAQTAESKSVQAACEAFARVLGSGNPDLPFGILYVLDEDGTFASLLAKTGIDDAFAPAALRLDHDDPWGVARVIREGNVILLNDLALHFGKLPGGVWPEPTTSAIVLPIAKAGQKGGTAGVLVAGINPRRALDDAYRGFFDLVAGHLATAVSNARTYEARARAERLEAQIKSVAGQREGGRPAIGHSAIWKDVLRKAVQVASTETTVILQGESGTGKEVVARFIHRASPRRDGPFVALNCAALPEQLLESELFGHDRGAFTGAQVAHAGKIEQAAGGVLFLDEVAEMSPAMQAKFLRVLEEHEYQRLGGTRTLKAEVRVLAATNRDLKAAIARGTFRKDLYYRLAVFDIALPPLRERPDDISLLTDAFLEATGRTVCRAAAGISDEARDRLLAYSWPGNVREPRNVIERAVILCEGGLITGEHLGGVEPVVSKYSDDSCGRLSERVPCRRC